MTRNALAVLALAALAGTLAWTFGPPRAPQPAPEAVAAPVPESPAPAPTRSTETVEIRRGDSVVAALRRRDVAASPAHEISQALREAGARMRQVRPGARLELARDGEGRLLAVAYAPTPWLRFVAEAEGHRWQGRREDTEPDLRVEVRQARIENSLWDAVQSGALSAQLLLDLVGVFESEFDFNADAQPGDRVRLLVEARYADGAWVDHGRILAAEYIGNGRKLTAVGFEVDGRFAYYDPAGRSLKKMFLRSPLEFTRISSGFTHRRLHPVLGGVRPHLAIDYAAPTGTPVWAVAEGVVRFAGFRGGNGIQVQLRHRAGFETYYNHLSRVARGIRPGVRVAQKQVIGYVGSTGLSTGPHLDYRVAHNGTFVNPLQEKFLPGEPMPEAQRAAYAEHAGALLVRLERQAAEGQRLAQAEALLRAGEQPQAAPPTGR